MSHSTGFSKPTAQPPVPASHCTREHPAAKRHLFPLLLLPWQKSGLCLIALLPDDALVWLNNYMDWPSSVRRMRLPLPVRYLWTVTFKKQHNSSWAYDHLLSGTNFRRHNRAKTHSQDTNVTFYYKTWIPKDKRMRYILLRILLNMKAICKMEETLISFICWKLYWLLLKLRKIYVSCSKIYSITYYSRVTHQPSSRQENWIAPCCHQEAQPVSALWIFLASLDHK